MHQSFLLQYFLFILPFKSNSLFICFLSVIAQGWGKIYKNNIWEHNETNHILFLAFCCYCQLLLINWEESIKRAEHLFPFTLFHYEIPSFSLFPLLFHVLEGMTWCQLMVWHGQVITEMKCGNDLSQQLFHCFVLWNAAQCEFIHNLGRASVVWSSVNVVHSHSSKRLVDNFNKSLWNERKDSLVKQHSSILMSAENFHFWFPFSLCNWDSFL